MDFLALRNIRKSYATGDGPLAVIDGVSLDQVEGEAVSIVGASGSGKTTLLRIVAGRDFADSGTETVSVLLVPHDLEEAIFLGDRVIVLSARPARVMATIAIDIPKPRGHSVRATHEFQALREEIWQLLQKAS